MATIDFTEIYQKFEKGEALRMEGLGVIYDRAMSDRMVPGVEFEMFVNPIDKDDIYFSTRSACDILGLGRNWLNTSRSRPRIMAKLRSFGLPDRTMIEVRITERLTRQCDALDRAGFNALLRYAREAGKPQAEAIAGAFLGLGLASSAGLGDLDSEEIRDRFRWFYNEMIEGQKNARK